MNTKVKPSSAQQNMVPVVKAQNEELMQATYIVMIPDQVDAHGDIVSEEEVRKSCYNFNKFCMQPNLFHMSQTTTFEFCESFILPTDIVLGDTFVKKGTWVATVQALSEDLWELMKSGEICALSIGALAKVEELEED